MKRKGMSGIIGIVLAVILVAAVAIPVVLNMNTTTWDATTKTVWAVLPVALVLIPLILAFTLVGAGR
jgi:hypothetical protein